MMWGEVPRQVEITNPNSYSYIHLKYLRNFMRISGYKSHNWKLIQSFINFWDESKYLVITKEINGLYNIEN